MRLVFTVSVDILDEKTKPSIIAEQIKSEWKDTKDGIVEMVEDEIDGGTAKVLDFEYYK